MYIYVGFGETTVRPRRELFQACPEVVLVSGNWTTVLMCQLNLEEIILKQGHKALNSKLLQHVPQAAPPLLLHNV